MAVPLLDWAVSRAGVGSLAFSSDENTGRAAAEVIVAGADFALEALVLEDAGFVPYPALDQDFVALGDGVAVAWSVSAVFWLLSTPLHLQLETSR